MDHDPNAHDPTIGDDDGEPDYYEEEFDWAAEGDDPDGVPSTGPAPKHVPGRSYSQMLRESQGKSMDDLMREAAERVANPPRPISDDEKAKMESDVDAATSKALKAGGGCPACGSTDVEEQGGQLVCSDCGAQTPVGPRVWSVVEPAGRHAVCSELCAKVGAARTGGDIVPPAPWTAGGEVDKCFACDGEIEVETPVATSPPVVQPLGGGLTAVHGVPVVGQADCPFSVGDRVRAKNPNPGVDPKHWTGTVAKVPDGPLMQLGGQTIGDEVAVDTDSGSRAVAPVDHWELVTTDGGS